MISLDVHACERLIVTMEKYERRQRMFEAGWRPCFPVGLRDFAVATFRTGAFIYQKEES